MAKTELSDLVQTFLEEHRTLMQGLSAILEKVESEDFDSARKQADELDQVVGPHIRFEEEVLYPEVGRVRGRQMEQQLLAEHSVIQRTIERLLEVDLSQADAPVLREELGAALRAAVRHAESCGTLISHLMALPPAEQDEALARLVQFHESGKRWTEMSDARRRD